MPLFFIYHKIKEVKIKELQCLETKPAKHAGIVWGNKFENDRSVQPNDSSMLRDRLMDPFLHSIYYRLIGFHFMSWRRHLCFIPLSVETAVMSVSQSNLAGIELLYLQVPGRFSKHDFEPLGG